MINANATGTEILKNLVLPGIGSFTIIDDSVITEKDLGNNFFLTKDSIGKSRAKEATEMLKELNPEVRGDYLEEHLETLLNLEGKFFCNFSVVIAAGINSEKVLNKLSDVLWNLNIPLVVCKAVGFVGYIRVQLREHTVIESHPDNTLEDLRLDNPFPALREHFEKFYNLDELSRKELAHLPYLIILNKYLMDWRMQKGKPAYALPSNYREKEELRQLIKNAEQTLRQIKANENNNALKDLEFENFEEAVKAVNKVLTPSNKIPSNLQEILNDPVINEAPKSTFWVLVKALKEFISKNNCLPVRGVIPDMISDSKRYITLQKIYANKAKEDVEIIYSLIHSNSSAGKLVDKITENEVKLFCKNASYLRVVRSSLIKNELTSEALKELVSSLVNDSCNDELVFYLLLRASEKFYSLYNHSPGEYDNQVENDIVQLKVFYCLFLLLNFSFYPFFYRAL